jgi:hypothetical protein
MGSPAREAPRQRLEREQRFEPRERRAEAEMHPEPEGQVRVGSQARSSFALVGRTLILLSGLSHRLAPGRRLVQAELIQHLAAGAARGAGEPAASRRRATAPASAGLSEARPGWR